MVVYLITCVIDGKVYVGKTVQTSHARWRQHRTEARIGRKNTPLVEAIRTHGPENFTVTDLCERDSQAKINAAERRYIREFDSDNPDKGYNVKQAGGGGGGRPKKRFVHDPLPSEHKQKIRASLLAFYASRRSASVAMLKGGGHFECQMIRATL